MTLIIKLAALARLHFIAHSPLHSPHFNISTVIVAMCVCVTTVLVGEILQILAAPSAKREVPR